MIVRAVSSTLKGLLDKVSSGWTEDAILHISNGKDYEVHGIAVCQYDMRFQIVDDDGWETWLPSCLFELVEGSVPKDWVSNIFPGNQEFLLIFAPSFILESEQAFYDMIEHVPDQVHKFHERLRRLKEERES